MVGCFYPTSFDLFLCCDLIANKEVDLLFQACNFNLSFFFFFFFFFRPNRIIANQQNYALHLLLYPQSLLLTGWCSVVLFSVLIEKRRVRGFSYA